MTNEERLLAEQACARLITAFALHNDAGRYEDMVQVFAEDAAFARPTDPDNFTVGRDAILAAFKARAQDRVSRHLITNILVDVISETEARGTCYATLFTASPDNKAPKMGLQANPSQFIGEFFVDFRLTAEGWKIARQTGNITLAT